MESFDDDLSNEISLKEVFENNKDQEKKEKKKKFARDYQRKYNKRPEIKERNAAKRIARSVAKRLKKMDEDQHKICKKLGHTIAHSRRNSEYYFKCTHCSVSYSDKEKIHFYNGNKCPCCHMMLRRRKTIAQKRNMTIGY